MTEENNSQSIIKNDREIERLAITLIHNLIRPGRCTRRPGIKNVAGKMYMIWWKNHLIMKYSYRTLMKNWIESIDHCLYKQKLSMVQTPPFTKGRYKGGVKYISRKGGVELKWGIFQKEDFLLWHEIFTKKSEILKCFFNFYKFSKSYF